MKQPDPVQHMMLWGASSSALVLILYFFAIGSLGLSTLSPAVIILLLGGIFTGFTLGGMAGVIIGTIFQHQQAAINSEKLHNRRLIVLGGVFVMVLIISRLLLILSFGVVGHPLALALAGALIALLASEHYLRRMQAWLKHNKPKRKRHDEAIPHRLLDDEGSSADTIPQDTQSRQRDQQGD
ncbi:MAG: hypothetical protein ACFE0Q_16525 [Anaerolineae bacterium]